MFWLKRNETDFYMNLYAHMKKYTIKDMNTIYNKIYIK